jgi:ribosome biogenesis GTPase / thiamine phosphate phosphatase
LPASPPDATLARFGWDDDVASALVHAPAGTPGRVSRVDRGLATVERADGPVRATASGGVATGDWVVVDASDPPAIVSVLPRRTTLVRHAAGREAVEQVLAANVDTVFIVTALQPSPNLRRLERGLALAWSSGATPVVVLTKADRCTDLDETVAAVQTVALGADVVVTSAVTGLGVDALRPYVNPGPDGRVPTVALIGASGAGKSTLVNALAGGEVMATAAVRAGDGKGRHTTSHRELVPLPSGGLLLDTPGLRGLQLWLDSEGIDAAFADIDELAGACHFGDCSHGGEPGCAVAGAIAAGVLPAERLASWRKLQRELVFLESRHDQRLAAERKRRWIRIAKSHRARTREIRNR